MFHLLTVFLINVAKQEKYHITNMLKKPQHVKLRQFVDCVEQLNANIVQMSYFYNSLSFNTTTNQESVPFTEAELGSHVLRICPIQWQDQYNLYKKGMTPMDLCLLLMTLEAIEHVCTQDKAKTECSKKASHKGTNGKKRPGTSSMARVLRKLALTRSIATCARSMGSSTPCTIPRIVIGMRKMERRKPISVLPRKVERSPTLQGRTSRS
jgi:hypothetical protein